MMKKHCKKMFAVMIAAGMLFSSAQTVSAGTENVYGEGTSQVNANGTTYDGLDNLTALPTDPVEFDVQATVSGYAELKYSIDINYGNMQFEYYYGDDWDPETHTYQGNGGNAVGWTDASVNGTNNKITIENDSNFPITAAFAYTANGAALNANPNALGSVVGIFNTVNNNVKSATEYGKGHAFFTTNPKYLAPDPLIIEMNASQIPSGTAFFYKSKSNGSAANATADMFFALSGRPDANSAVSSLTSVGTISVTIAPATGVTKKVKP